MSCSTSTPEDLTLATLPPDIIRIIIRMNTGECMEGTKYISPNWNRLVYDYLTGLPPVEYFLCCMMQNKNVSALIKIDPMYYTHFKPVLPEEWTSEKDIVTLPFEKPATHQLLSHLFRRTNKIKKMGFYWFEKQELDIMRKTMSNVQIDEMWLNYTQFDLDMRKCIREVIRLHHIYEIHLIPNSTCYNDEMCEALNNIPEQASIVKFRNYTGKEDGRNCESLAQDLVENKGKKLVQFIIGRVVYERGEPFLMFMRNFLHYDLF